MIIHGYIEIFVRGLQFMKDSRSDLCLNRSSSLYMIPLKGFLFTGNLKGPPPLGYILHEIFLFFTADPQRSGKIYSLQNAPISLGNRIFFINNLSLMVHNSLEGSSIHSRPLNMSPFHRMPLSLSHTHSLFVIYTKQLKYLRQKQPI